MRRVDVRHADANDLDHEPAILEMDDLRLAVGRRDVGRVSTRDRLTLVGIRADRLDDVIEAIGEATYAERPQAP